MEWPAYLSENLVHLPKECVMDVSIKSSDKQAREAFIKARDEKQAAKDLRAQQREDKATNRRQTVNHRRLRRRIDKAVRSHLSTEKQHYLQGEATGGEYVINTQLSYRGDYWRYKPSFVESILKETLAKHSGFEHKVDFWTRRTGYCYSMSIWYTLLENWAAFSAPLLTVESLFGIPLSRGLFYL